MTLVDPNITPTGILVYSGPPKTLEWFKVRTEGITGTDLPKILGLSKYGNALSVWRDKRGEADPDITGEAAHWGNLLEDIVAQEWAFRNQTEVTPVGVIANVNHLWQRASLDRLVRGCPDLPAGSPLICGLEVKTRSAYKRGSFRDKEPDDVLAQVAWGLLTTGLQHMHIAVLIGGQELLSFRVDRDPVLEEYLVDAAKTVWDAVQAGDPPTVHPDAEGVLLSELNAIYVKRAGEVELPDDPQIHELIQTYRENTRVENAAKREKTKAKSGLIQYLHGGDTGTIDGAPVFTYLTPDPADQITSDSLRKLKAEHPRVYARLVKQGVITKTEPNPRFSLKRRGE